MHHGHGHGHAGWQWTCIMKIYIHGENFVAVIGLSGSWNTVLCTEGVQRPIQSQNKGAVCLVRVSIKIQLI